MPSRWLVTGGAGFLGSRLCEVLLEQGEEVVCVDDLSTGRRENVAHLDGPGFEVREADVSDGLDVDGPVGFVLHLAAPASPLAYQRLPVETLRVGSEGTMRALELAERTGARFVLASTSEVYGDPLEHPQRETYWGNVNPVGPRAVYDESKRFAEAATMAWQRSRGVDAGIVRIFNTFGPRMALDDGRVVPTFIRQAIVGEPLTVAGDGSQTRSLCFVDDTVDGILRMARSGEVGPVNLGGQQEHTVLEIAKTILRLTASTSAIEHVDLPEDDPKVRRPDTSRAWELLGWSPQVGVEEGLRRTVEWARGLEELADRAHDVVGVKRQ